MNISKPIAASSLMLAFMASSAFAGALDPDCTPAKAAKSAAAKSTVGVGGRCGAGEAVKDTAKDAAGVDDKGPVEKHKKKNDTPAGKAKDAAKKAAP